jgi:hypothetical protein
MAPLKRMSNSEAVGVLRGCLADGQVIPTKHFRDELANEGLDFQDALCVLGKGTIYDPPEPDIKTGEWKYGVQGREPGGKHLKIVLSFRTINQVLLITVFSISGRHQ